MSAYEIKPQPCPYCQFPMEADYVDVVGVGMVQCGPHVCEGCGASEIGPEYARVKAEGQLDADEVRTGFYKSRISPHANQHNGKVITHKQADARYRAKHFAEHGNPFKSRIIK